MAREESEADEGLRGKDELESLEVTETVLDYLMNEQALRQPVSNKDLHMKALETGTVISVQYHQEYIIQNYILLVPSFLSSDFVASPMWFKRWA